jgi:hypothetical protein
MMSSAVGLQELVHHVLRVAATPQHRDKRAIALRWSSVPCRGPAPNCTVALKEAWSSRPASLPNRGEWLILGTTYPIMQSGKRRARRERDTVFTILPAHGVTVAATLSHKGQQYVIHVPIDSGPFCVDQNWLDFGTAVSSSGKYPLWVSYSVLHLKESAWGGSSDDEVRVLHQLAVE